MGPTRGAGGEWGVFEYTPRGGKKKDNSSTNSTSKDKQEQRKALEQGRKKDGDPECSENGICGWCGNACLAKKSRTASSANPMTMAEQKQ